jgi:hypothetical protein
MQRVTMLAFAALTLGGCSNAVLDPNGYGDRRDQIWLSAGEALANNKAIQTIDPWPVYSGNTRIAYNGQRMQTAVERYRYNKVIAPRGISASSTYTPPADNSAANAANNAPLGPTVNAPPGVK